LCKSPIAAFHSPSCCPSDLPITSIALPTLDCRLIVEPDHVHCRLKPEKRVLQALTRAWHCGTGDRSRWSFLIYLARLFVCHWCLFHRQAEKIAGTSS
jgi:hypothetical protein